MKVNDCVQIMSKTSNFFGERGVVISIKNGTISLKNEKGSFIHARPEDLEIIEPPEFNVEDIVMFKYKPKQTYKVIYVEENVVHLLSLVGGVSSAHPFRLEPAKFKNCMVQDKGGRVFYTHDGSEGVPIAITKEEKVLHGDLKIIPLAGKALTFYNGGKW